ncbi:MAG: hypothetical protein CMO14_04515, partial [Thaumarchaeota archaeon]|nr:hypothetical protein [Nitrososphaerota archaeon]
MATLVSTAKKLTKQKLELSKIRRSSEKEFKKAKAVSRKYSSSLTSLQKRVNSSREQAEDLGQILNQKIAQIESVQRLKNAAIEKLGLETQSKEQLEGESDFANTDEEKHSIESRLQIILSTIDDIKSEIKQRTSMEKKLQQSIDEYNKSKSTISSKIKKNLESKPTLVKMVKTSKNKVEVTAKKFNSSKSRENSAKNRLVKISSELSEILKKKAKAKPKTRKAKAKPKTRKAKAKPKTRKA